MMEQIRLDGELRRKFERLTTATKAVELPYVDGRLIPNVRFSGGRLYQYLGRCWSIIRLDGSQYESDSWLDALETHQANFGSEVIERITPEFSYLAERELLKNGYRFNDAFDLLRKLQEQGIAIKPVRSAWMPVIHVTVDDD